MEKFKEAHQKVAEHYEKYPYPNYPAWISGSWRQLDSVDLRNWQINRDIRDAWITGCGTIAPLMFGLRNPNVRFTASDLSKTSLRKLKLRLFLQGIHNVQTKVEDITESLYKEAFDAIDSYGVLHHTQNPKSSLNHLIQALRPQGVIRLMLYSEKHSKPYLELRQLIQKMNEPSIFEVRRLAQQHHGNSIAREDKASLADTFLNPIMHIFSKADIDELIQSVTQNIEALDIQEKKNWILFLRKK